MGYRYIGSKTRVMDDIIHYLGKPTKSGGVFIDAFCGTGVVASRAADVGWTTHVNDMMEYASVISEARLLSTQDINFINFGGYEGTLKYLNSQEAEGFIWKEYSPASKSQVGIERKYFTEENAKRIDGATLAIHKMYNEKAISSQERSLLLATVIYATNSVANIAGTYGCFLSKWTAQSQNSFELVPLTLRKDRVYYKVSNLDVFQIISEPEDVVYLDPPYTKRQYASYYHILETIVKGDSPVVEGVSGLRKKKKNSSVFCYKMKALQALVDLTIKQKARQVLVSYSNDGHIQLDQFVDELQKHGAVRIVELGSIGRYRPNAIASSHKPEVKEYLVDYRRKEDSIDE